MAAASPSTHDGPRCIHLAGVDGSGKTTQARALVARIEADGGRARLVWLRFPRLFSIPLLVYARLRGFSRREVVNGVEHGYWNFAPSWLLRTILPWALLVDTLLLSLVRIYLPLLRGERLVCDRFVADILTDLSVGLDDPRLDERLPGRLFLALMPPGTRVVVLDIESELARERSPELRGDRSHARRRRQYLEIAARRGFTVISSAPPPEAVSRALLATIGRAPESGTPGGYAKVSSPWLRWIVGHPVGAIASHWLFQGLLYMDRSERIYKLVLDGAGTLALAGLLRRRLPARRAIPLAALVAHTLNFLFNGQLFGVLKHFGMVHTSYERYSEEVEALRRAVEKTPGIRYAAAYGSLARDAWSSSSDLDVRVVRAPGLASALRVCTFALRARARALARGFPLDLYVLDSYAALDRMAESSPIWLGGSDHELPERG